MRISCGVAIPPVRARMTGAMDSPSLNTGTTTDSSGGMAVRILAWVGWVAVQYAGNGLQRSAQTRIINSWLSPSHQSSWPASSHGTALSPGIVTMDDGHEGRATTDDARWLRSQLLCGIGRDRRRPLLVS